MPQILEYDYYNAVLTIEVFTTRPEAAPSGVLVAGTMHDEYAARARAYLREFRDPLTAYLPYYRVTKLRPMSSSHEVDEANHADILTLQFAVEITLTEAAWIADEMVVFAFERNLQKAVRDYFKARQLSPETVMPGDTTTLGPSYVSVMISMGDATEQNLWQVSG